MIKIFCDGASKGNPGRASIGVSFVKNDKEIETISLDIGISTNNFSEWTSLITSLEKAIYMNELFVEVYMDSELVVKQVKGLYKVKSPDLKPFKEKFDSLVQKFKSFEITHIKREKNKRADKLANLAFK